MSIYYENGCFSLWSAESLDSLPKTTVKKIVKMLCRNQNRAENEEAFLTFCEWLCNKLDFFKRKFAADRNDKATERQLKFYISLAEVI